MDYKALFYATAFRAMDSYCDENAANPESKEDWERCMCRFAPDYTESDALFAAYRSLAARQPQLPAAMC